MTHLALRDVMSHEFVGVSEADALRDAVELMRSEHTISAVVLRGNDPVGVVTAGTVFDFLLEDGTADSVTVSDVMEETPASLPLGASIAEAADVMGRTGDPRVLVVDEDEEVRGIVEARDVAPAITERTDRAPTAQAQTVGGNANPGEPGDDDADGPTDEYADGPAHDYAEQGVCESCGSIATELANVNGRLLCTECRSV